MNLDEIIKKQKEHLTQAQIKALAQAAERYKQVSAAQRAEAYSSLHKGLSATRRGLQNVGLAGRAGKIVSGQQKAAAIRAQEAYSDYSAGLDKVATAYTQQAAARMSRETMIQEHLADLQEQQQKINAEAEKVRKEYQAYLARKRAAEEAARKAAEEAAKQQGTQNGLPNYNKPDLRGVGLAALQHGLENYNPMQHGTSENISYFKLVAQQNGLKGASANDYAVKMAAEVANQKVAAASALKPELSTKQLAFASKYMSDPVNRFASEYDVNQEHMQELRKTNPEVLDTIRSTYKTIDEKQEAWNAAIAKGEGIVKPKNRNEYERWDDARKARIEMANAYSTLGRITLAAEAGSAERNNPNGVLHTQKAVVSEDGKYLLSMPERTMYLLSDADFAAAFDAAERLYRKGQLSDEDFTRYESVKAGRELSSERAMKHGLVEPDNKYTSKYQQKNSMSSYWAGKDKPDGYTDEQWSEITRDHEYYVPLADPDVRSYDKKYGTEDSDYAGIVNYVSRMLDYSERAYLYTARNKMGLGHMRGENQHFIQSVVWYKDNVVKGETTEAGKYSKAEAISIAASYMTDEEIDRFNTILALYGAKEADDYFELLYETVLPARVNQAIDEDYDAMLRRETKYDENGNRIGSTQGKDTWALQITSTLLSTPLNIVEGILNPWMTAKTDLQDPTAARLSAREGSSAQEIRNAVQENFSNRGRFWYGVGTSTLDSVTVAAISGGLGEAFASMGVPAKLAGHAGSIFGGSILGGASYNSSYSEALQRGLTPDKARATAFGNGLNEMLFESLSLDLLVSRFKTGDILKVSKDATVNWLVNTLVEAGVEGSEEVFTDMANNLWDKFINGVYSEEVTKLRQYIASGMSYDEAKRKVNEEFAEQLWESFKAGAISGGVMGGAAGARYNFTMRGFEKQGKSLDSGLRSKIDGFQFKDKQMQELQQQSKKTNQDYGVLLQGMLAEKYGQFEGNVQQAVNDGTITKEDAALLEKWQKGEVTAEQMQTVNETLSKLDIEPLMEIAQAQESILFNQQVGVKNAETLRTFEAKQNEAQKQHEEEVAKIEADETLTDAQKEQKKAEAYQKMTEAQSRAGDELSAKVGRKIDIKVEKDGTTVRTKKGSGKVTFDFSTYNNGKAENHNTVESMTERERAALRIAQVVAALNGTNIKVEAQFTSRTLKDGTVEDLKDKNGYYDAETDTIHVNLNGTNSVLWTISHELTHRLATMNKQGYTELHDAIKNELTKENLTYSEVQTLEHSYQIDKLQEYLNKGMNLWDALVAYEESRGYKGADAEEEVIARCCEQFLAKTTFINSFASKHYKTARSISAFLTRMNADMQQLFADVNTRSTIAATTRNAEGYFETWNTDVSPEQDILNQVDALDDIARKWENAVKKVGQKRVKAEVRNTAKAETRSAAKTETRAEVQEEHRAMPLKSTDIQNFPTIGAEDTANIERTAKRQDKRLKEKGFTEENAQHYYDMVTSAVEDSTIGLWRVSEHQEEIAAYAAQYIAEHSKSRKMREWVQTKENAKAEGVKASTMDKQFSMKNDDLNAASTYTYDHLTAQPDMVIVTVQDIGKFRTGDKVDRSIVKKTGMKNAENNGERIDSDTVKVQNRYTARQLQVSEASIRHGLNGKFSRLSINSKLGAAIGDLAKNAIPVNSMDASNVKAEYTYPMVAYAQDSDSELLAILHVDHYRESIASVELYDVVHSVNGRIRKNSTTATMPTRFTAENASPSNAVSTISIADVLSFVKDLHPDILSKSVLDHFGMERPDGYYKDQVKFSTQDIETSETEQESKKYTPETTMTMAQAKRMLEMTFNANGFRGYKGYKNAEEWLKAEGAKEVAWYAENTETVVEQYFNRFPELTDYDVTIEEVLEAYQKGTLVGKEKAAKEKVDLKTGTGYKDSRFYAPKSGTVTDETIKTANLRVTSTNREEVYAARREILFAAHTDEGLAAIGLTPKELNKKLQNWSRYSERARTLSMKLNQDVAEEYRWTGLQNCSILSTINVTDQDIRSLVKDIVGTSSEYQRNYIGRTMLALDTHIDWSELTFEFTKSSNAKEGARGYYDDSARHIAVGSSGYLNTVAHEMGHALDYKWGRELFTNMSVPITQQHVSNESKIASEEGRKFYRHFAEFSQKVEDACDIRSSYTQRGTEAFARFVARFVEWTANTAGSQRNYESQYYNDRFTIGLYLEFVQILQEKARLDSMMQSETRYSTQDKDFHLTQRIGEQRVYEMRGTTANVYGSSVELEGATLLNRVRMMQNLAEMYGSVTAHAADAKEAQAFEKAGAQRVADPFVGENENDPGTWEFTHTENKYGQDTKYDAKQKRNFANAVLKEVGTYRNFKREDLRIIRARLEKAFAILHNAWHGQGDQLVAWEYADRLFDAILNRYTEMSEADAEMRDAILAEIPSRRDAKGHIIHDIEVTASQMAEIKHVYGSVAAYNQALTKALGTRVYVKEAQNAQTLEDVFANNPYLDATTNEGDMPTVLLERAQETVGKRTNPYKADSEERAALKEAMFEKALTIVGIEKSTAQKVREAVKQARAEERAKAKDKTANAVAKVRAEERAKSRKREAKLKEVTQKKIANLKVEQLRKDVKTIALKWNQRLVKMLANPTEASHIPVQLAREVAEFTDALTRFLDSGTERGQINLAKIAKAYQQAFDDQATIAQAKAENPKYDPRGQVIDREMYDEQLVQMMNELNEVLQGKTLKDLNPFEMRMLLNTVRGVAHTVYDANRMIGTSERKAIWQVGSTMVDQLENAPSVSTALRGYLETSLDLRRMAKVFSGSNENAEFVKLVKQLNDGAIEKERIAQTLQSIFAPVTDQYGDEIRKWYGKNAEWIDTGITKNGKKIEITKGMRVSLALHVLNEGNMRHIENGGLTIPNREMYRKGKMQDAYANGQLVRLNAEQINEIVSHMTEAEKAYVEAAKELFHKRTGYFINKTSLALLGYRKATVENYFPIHTDKNFTKTDFASLKMDGSIEGQGFLKERVLATNPVYLEDITSVVNRQIRGVALYAGLAIPMRNFNAVMNASIYEDDNGVWSPRTTVKQTLTQKIGAYGAKVVDGFLTDVSEMSHVDVSPMERFAGKLATNYVKAVLLGNMKVALKQVASYPTAAAVIPWKYLAKGLASGKVDVDLIDQYTPLYQLRREGNANEIASIMAKRGMEQKLPWLLGLITKMDVATVGRIWKAAEYMVADQQKNLPVGSDAYYQAVAKVFNDTVQQTQPNFTPLQRNAALRSKNPIVRSLVLFGTQRMQNGGILTEATMELAQSKGKSKEEIKAARQKLGRAVASQIVQNILLIAAEIGKDFLLGRMLLWQDDDEKKVTAESLLKVMGDKFLSNMMGSFLGGSEIYNLVIALFKKATGETAYDTEFTVPALDAAETILNFVEDLPDVIKYLTGDHADEEKLKKAKNWSMQIAKAFGYATGIPLENAVKDLFKGIIPAIKDHVDYFKTGEFPQWWLHQSGKLDSSKTAVNYKEWTKEGKKGSVYLYWENVAKNLPKEADTGYPKSEQLASKLLVSADLTPDEKAMLYRMLGGSDLENDGAVVYHPLTVNQKLKDDEREHGTVAVDFTNIDRYRMSQMGDAKYNGFLKAVEMGVPEDVAATAYWNYANAKKYEFRRGVKADVSFRDWLFKMVSDPAQRAILDMQVVGKAERVEGAIGYKKNGEVYADYSTKAMFDAYMKGKKTEKAEAVSNLGETPQQKAEAFASMYQGYTAKDGIVYNDKGVVQADYTSDEAYEASQIDESHYAKYTAAVKAGMSRENALKAAKMHKEIMNDDDKDNSTQAVKWIFSEYKNANDRAIAGTMFTTKTVTVKDGRTYDENGYIYRDYTSVAWYKLSNRTLSKDGMNKRYEAAKEMTQFGYTAEQIVAMYVDLDKYSKKSEWTSYLKDKGLTQEQINIILWSRGWYKRK